MKKLELVESDSVSGFYPREIDHKADWVWSRGGESTIRGNVSGVLEYHFQIPKAGTNVVIRLGKAEERRIASDRDWQNCTGRIQVPAGPWGITFTADRWNGNGTCIAPQDLRELSLLFITVKMKEDQPCANEKDFGGKICPIPFSRLESLYPFAPCNRWYLKDEILLEEPEADPWNGRAAKLLRESMYDGSFRYCRRDLCQNPLLDPAELEKADPPISAKNIEAIRGKSSHMPDGPSMVAIVADPRCNLACPTCRPSQITALSRDDEREIGKLDDFLQKSRESVRSLVFAVNGDVFFSPYLRGQLKNTSRDLFPNFQSVEILSNGLLFDQKALDQTRPGSDFIKRVYITVDAGDADTYKRARGGDWDRLVRNLEWIAGLRRSGRFEWFRLVFVVRRENFRSLPKFFELAQRLGVDEVLLSRLLDWSNMKTDFDAEAVCQPGHPDHEELKKIWVSLRARPWDFQVTSTMFWDYQNNRQMDPALTSP